MPEQPRELSDLAERQQQIVTRTQLLGVGYDDMYLYRQTRRGLWQRVLPATYALVTGTLTDEQRRSRRRSTRAPTRSSPAWPP